MTTEQESAKMWKATENTALENLFHLMGRGMTEATCVGILLQKIKEHPEIKNDYKARTRFHINNVIKMEAAVLDEIKHLFASKVTRSYVYTCFENACDKAFEAGHYLLDKEKQETFTILKREAQQELIYAYKEIKGMKYNEAL